MKKTTFISVLIALSSTLLIHAAKAEPLQFTEWEKSRFAEIDSNNDNQLDQQEFRATTRGWMTKSGFDEQKQIKLTNKKFRRYDANGDNGISIMEFVQTNRQSKSQKAKPAPKVKQQIKSKVEASRLLGKAKNQKLALGDKAPNALGTDRNGDDVNISDLQGKVVVVSYWVSWCKPCKKELAVLHNLQRKLGDDLIKVVSINLKESRNSYKKLIKQMSGLDVTLTHDTKGFIARRYGVEKAPSLFVIDQFGKISYINHGYKATPINEVVNVVKRLYKQS